MVKQGRHESTDQELDTEKFVQWHSRVVLNEMIRVAQAEYSFTSLTVNVEPEQ